MKIKSLFNFIITFLFSLFAFYILLIPKQASASVPYGYLKIYTEAVGFGSTSVNITIRGITDAFYSGSCNASYGQYGTRSCRDNGIVELVPSESRSICYSSKGFKTGDNGWLYLGSGYNNWRFASCNCSFRIELPQIKTKFGMWTTDSNIPIQHASDYSYWYYDTGLWTNGAWKEVKLKWCDHDCPRDGYTEYYCDGANIYKRVCQYRNDGDACLDWGDAEYTGTNCGSSTWTNNYQCSADFKYVQREWCNKGCSNGVCYKDCYYKNSKRCGTASWYDVSPAKYYCDGNNCYQQQQKDFCKDAKCVSEYQGKLIKTCTDDWKNNYKCETSGDFKYLKRKWCDRTCNSKATTSDQCCNESCTWKDCKKYLMLESCPCGELIISGPIKASFVNTLRRYINLNEKIILDNNMGGNQIKSITQWSDGKPVNQKLFGKNWTMNEITEGMLIRGVHITEMCGALERIRDVLLPGITLKCINDRKEITAGNAIIKQSHIKNLCDDINNLAIKSKNSCDDDEKIYTKDPPKQNPCNL